MSGPLVSRQFSHSGVGVGARVLPVLPRVFPSRHPYGQSEVDPGILEDPDRFVPPVCPYPNPLPSILVTHSSPSRSPVS